jgi:hypothetical protein
MGVDPYGSLNGKGSKRNFVVVAIVAADAAKEPVAGAAVVDLITVFQKYRIRFNRLITSTRDSR